MPFTTTLASLDFDVVFGPALQAFPFHPAMGINGLYGKLGFSTAPTEKKPDHGADAGMLGARGSRQQRVVMVEDVTTSGKSIEETYPMITSMAKIR